jgi:hypothetical protein
MIILGLATLVIIDSFKDEEQNQQAAVPSVETTTPEKVPVKTQTPNKKSIPTKNTQ